MLDACFFLRQFFECEYKIHFKLNLEELKNTNSESHKIKYIKSVSSMHAQFYPFSEEIRVSNTKNAPNAWFKLCVSKVNIKIKVN